MYLVIYLFFQIAITHRCSRPTCPHRRATTTSPATPRRTAWTRARSTKAFATCRSSCRKPRSITTATTTTTIPAMPRAGTGPCSLLHSNIHLPILPFRTRCLSTTAQEAWHMLHPAPIWCTTTNNNNNNNSPTTTTNTTSTFSHHLFSSNKDNTNSSWFTNSSRWCTTSSRIIVATVTITIAATMPTLMNIRTCFFILLVFLKLPVIELDHNY